VILLVLSALAEEPAPASTAPASTAPASTAPAPTEPALTAPAAASTAPAPAGYVPPVPHPSVDPLMPQSYRVIPRGDYPCKVNILVTETGTVRDVEKIECDQDAYYALATAIVQWKFDPATQDGKPVASELVYENVFSVESFLPRKHIVGFVGAVVSGGGAGWFGAEGRVHLGEQLSLSGGLSIDQDFVPGVGEPIWVPNFFADVAISSKRRHFEHRGIYGFAVGGFGDPYGSVGMYGAFRGEVMTPIPGLSIGGDAGAATLFTEPQTYPDVGVWQRDGRNPFYPWLRLSVIWYAPLPKDRFVVVAREMDPTVYEPIIPEPEPLPDTWKSFEGYAAIHWSQIEPSWGENTPVGEAFAQYPPGTYRCDVRALIDNQGKVVKVRAETCPKAGREAAEKNVAGWEWEAGQAYAALQKIKRDPGDPASAAVQAVFPAPIYVRGRGADMVPAQSVNLLVDGKPKGLPPRTPPPPIWVTSLVPPEWGQTRPSGACLVDVDLDETGAVLRTRWAGGEIEVSTVVFDALKQWKFYPVIVRGEPVAARVRLSMCDY
jgi:hypothetical protein